MIFGLLGPVLVSDGDRQVCVPASRQRTVLAVLLLNAGVPVSVDELAEAVWDGRPPSSARATLGAKAAIAAHFLIRVLMKYSLIP